VICVIDAVPQCLEIAPIFTTANEWMPVFSVVVAIGLIIAFAITGLVAIGNVIRASYEFTRHEPGKRKSKDEEEKPKRKFVNGILMREGDWINEALMEPEDGDIVYYEFEDEEERIEHR
jgi:hypothetical protein